MEPVAHIASDPASSDDEVLGAVGDRRGSAGRRLVIGITSLLVFGAGMGAGVALPDDTSKLEAAQDQVERERNQVENLQSALATSQDDNAALTASLDTAEAAAEAAGQAAASRQRKVDAREAELDERAAELDTREAELDERAAELDGREAELDERELGLDGPDDSSAAPTGSTSSSEFDRAWAVDIASDIVHDVKTVDHRLGDGISVESAMFLLSGNFPRLLDAGLPPGVDEAEYVARLETLESFTDQAADLYSINATEGSARYAVVREQTGRLLDELNTAIGSDFRLP